MKLVEGIWIPKGDTHFPPILAASPKVDGKATYQLKKYHEARKHVRAFGFAVDVGGHVGLWARVMAKDFEHVVSFEPMPIHQQCYERNLEGHNNVTLFRYALSDRQTTLNIHMPADNTGHSHAASSPNAKDVTLVPAVPMDALEFPARIDFLKIDVEGYEKFVVLGAEQTIRDHKPVIIIEQKPNGNAERYGEHQHAAVNLLKAWGMREVGVMAGDHILVWA
jgi:FkbM family methyltransferase